MIKLFSLNHHSHSLLSNQLSPIKQQLQSAKTSIFARYSYSNIVKNNITEHNIIKNELLGHSYQYNIVRLTDINAHTHCLFNLLKNN